jgi:hypothetical protein
MRAAFRTLLILEVLVCFGPMALMLMIGALLIPIQIAAMIHEPLVWNGPVEVIGSVLCGAVGLSTPSFLLITLFEPPAAATVKRPCWCSLAPSSAAFR